MATFEIEDESLAVVTKIAKECAVEPDEVMAEAIGLLEMLFEEVNNGYELYIVNSRGKALNSVKLNIKKS